MRKCDWCKRDSTCRGVARSECIVREYRDFAMDEKTAQTSCCFCGKGLNLELSAAEIRGGIGGNVLARLCGDCYRKYRLLQKNRPIP